MTALAFASSFGDHAVLQQAPAQAVVWGFAPAALGVTLTLAGGGLSSKLYGHLEPFNATAYTWRVSLPPIGADHKPYSITIEQAGAPSATLRDVLFGEVWVCSGQSNMAFLVENAFGGADLVQDANNHPEIRLFTTRKLTAGSPLQELGQDTNEGGWVRGVELPWSIASNVSISDDGAHDANDDNWLYMSAVCYLYGLEIHTALGVPVGLMNTNWGGTAIQDWCPQQALDDCSHVAPTPGRLGVATHLYNAMIHPLMNHTIKGVVWYQGESNGGDPEGYSCLQPAMIKRWREGWAAGSNTDAAFPFGLVQLAGNTGDTFGLPQFRWLGQTDGYGVLPNPKMPNTFMAASYDLGDAPSPFGSVHSRNKKEVGHRLAVAGLRVAYGNTSVHAGPAFDSARKDGATVVLTFRDVGAAGLALSKMNVTKALNVTQWAGDTPFEVCVRTSAAAGDDDPCGAMGGVDGWSAPKTTALGAGGDTVVLGGLSGDIAAVRYAWRGYPCERAACGVHSKKEGLPPPPFYVAL